MNGHKNIIILFSLLFMQISNFSAQNNNSQHYVDVKGLYLYYFNNDTIQLSLINETYEMLYISISVEEDTESGWIRVVDDVFAKNKNKEVAKNTKLLLKKEEKTISIPITHLQELDLNANRLYRFALEIRDNPFNIVEDVYTQAFSFKPNNDS